MSEFKTGDIVRCIHMIFASNKKHIGKTFIVESVEGEYLNVRRLIGGSEHRFVDRRFEKI